MPEYCAIYALCCPVKGDVRYIGKTMSPKKRLRAHLAPNPRNTTPIAQWCRSLKKRGLTPNMRIIKYVSDWDTEERYYIRHYREQGANLLNVADGGQTMGHVHNSGNVYRGHNWALRFCGKTNNTELGNNLRGFVEQLRKEYGEYAVDNYNKYLCKLLSERGYHV